MEDRDAELGAPHPGLHLPLPMAGALDMSHGDLLARVDVLRHQQGCATETWQLGSNSPRPSSGRSGPVGPEGRAESLRPSWGLCPVHSGNCCTQITCPPARRLQRPWQTSYDPHPVSDRRPLCLLQWKAWHESADNTARGHCLR